MRWSVRLALLGTLLFVGTADAKKVRSARGPKPTPDTVLSVAEPELDPIVRAKGPRVPLTNLQLVTRVANMAYNKTLASAPLDSGGHVVLAPAESHHPLAGNRHINAAHQRSPDDP